MNNLPLNINSTMPAKTPVSASANDNSAQPAENKFNNVLARQVNDTDKQAQSNQSSQSSKSADSNAPKEESDNAAAIPTTDTTTSSKADMLASMLTQQNPAAPAQPTQQDTPVSMIQNPLAVQLDPLIQTTQSTQTPQSPPAPQAPQRKSKGENTAALASPLNNGLKGKAEPALEAMLAKAENPIKINNKLVAAAKSADLKALSADASSPALRNNFASELASAAQQSGFSATTLATNAPANPANITTAITQQPAWGDEFSQKITWMATQQNQSAELHLNPPQLGPLDVSIKMNGDQATATFTSPHAAVREAIEQAMPKLREMLADSGIMLGNAMVSDQPARNNTDHASGKSQGKNPVTPTGAVTDASAVQETRVSHIRHHNGMVDTFA